VSFAAPGVLLAGVVVLALLVVGLRRADRRRQADLARFASAHVLADLTADVSAPRRRLKRAMVVTGIGLVLLALAGPEIGHRFEESRRRGIDVLIAVDVSKSMLAGDVVPNRLERAKLAVADLVAQLGDRVGLIAFAGTAFLQCPLTLDHRAFDESLAVLAPDLIPQPGSNLASAIRVAEAALATEQRNVKLLVLFSDGEDLGGDAVEAATAAAKNGLRIFTVGVGTPAGELIPVPGYDGGTDFVKDAQGQIVKSRLDEATLTAVAEATGGFYVPLGARGEGIAAIRERALDPIPKEELAARLRQVPQNRFQWPLLLGVVLLLVEPLVSDRRRGARAAATAALAAGLALLPWAPADAASAGEAKRLYDAGQYAAARDAYRAAHEADPENRDLDFNLGAAAYKAGDFAAAAAAFARALQSEQPARQQQSFYNLGNTQFRLGEAAREQDPQQTMAAWQQALEAFDQAIALDAEDADAKWNRELVAKALEELQQQQQQQQQQDGEQRDQEQEQNQGQDQNQDQNQEQQSEQQQEQQHGQQQDQQPQDQQQQDQQQQDQQRNGDQNQQPREDRQQEGRQAGEQPESREAGADDTPKPASEQPQAGEQADGEPTEAAVPGRMTPTEARALLESLRGEERALPMLGQAGDAEPPTDGTVQDW